MSSDRHCRFSAVDWNVPKPKEIPMNTTNETRPSDPSTDELQTAEPLRIVLALGALILGVIMGLH